MFDTLLYLVEHAGQTLDKDELLGSIWPGVIVEENSLTQNISTLRQVLGEQRGQNRYIATIAREGYRFVAKVTTREELPEPTDAQTNIAPLTAPGPASSTRRRPRALVAGAVGALLTIVTITSVWFSLTERPSTSTRQAKRWPFFRFQTAATCRAQRIARETGMAQFLISSLGRTKAREWSARSAPCADTPRSTKIRLRRVASWSRHGARRFGCSDRVMIACVCRYASLRVAGRQAALDAKFRPELHQHLRHCRTPLPPRSHSPSPVRWVGTESTRGTPRTQDAEAYALYTSGQFAWSRQTERSLLQAITFFEQAIARDPNYALAYAGLADSYAVLGVFGMRTPP